MTGNIYINGVIGSDYNDKGELTEKGFELLDVIDQVKKIPNALNYNVFINSQGGRIDVGFQIYDYLKSLNKPIHTIGHGMVASIATVIFMAGEKRTLKPNTDFFIHLPSGGVYGTSEDIVEYANMIADEQKRILKFYKDFTDLTDEALLPLLRNETTLNVDQAYNLGFANTQPLAVEPVAYFSKLPKENTNTNNKNEMNLTAEDKSWIDKQFDGISNSISKLFKSTPKNVMETTADGETMIDFPDIEEGQPISLGTMATVDGAPAEGEYVMPSGNTFVFVAGELTEIKEPASEDGDEEGDEEMLAFIEDLKKQLSLSQEETKAAKKEVATAKKDKENLIKQVSNIKEKQEEFQKQLKSKFDFVARRENGNETDGDDKKSDAKNALEVIREKRKKQ